MPSPRSSILVLSVLALLLWCAPAQAERRTALVIGNGAYKAAPLKNPTNDAQDMADALRATGFDVTLKLNATHREMEEAVRAFGAKLKQGGLGLFYYAGHGVQVAGENYLIPVDTKIDAEADVKFGALNAGMTLARMEDAGNDMNIVILDACRTNPFARSFRTAEQGLARMDAPKGSLIAYATAPGRVAADSGGTGRNGVYTGFLLRHMRTPGLKVEEALKRVRADVVRATKDKQVPWESSSLMGDFYFVLSQVQTVQASVAPAQAATPALSPQKPAQAVKTKPPGKMSGKAEDWFLKGADAYEKSDYVEALKWLNKSAEQGFDGAQLVLGSMYFHGQGVGKDYSAAISWYRKAADNGNAEAQYSLGLIYSKGNGVAQNYAEAVRWLRKAAEQGNVMAQVSLGTKYAIGIGVEQNGPEAEKLLRQAADQGSKEAQSLLGHMYLFGQSGMPQNYLEAAKWYHKAADQGDVRAQTALGLMYEQGRGVPQDDAEAAKWYHKAADQGDVMAQYNIGHQYRLGRGVRQDIRTAHMWFSLASAQGDAKAVKSRNLAASIMTPAQLAEAQQMAREWKPKTAQQ